jgi:antitoxin (DNA-binding transcriptional repressor) of toxin-antitoxin stability system
MTVALEATQTTLSALMESIERGDEVRLLKNGRAVATIVPDPSGNTPKRIPEQIAETQSAFDEIRKQAKSLKLGSFDWEECKANQDLSSGQKSTSEEVRAAMERIRERAKTAGMKFDWNEIKAWRNEGRA